MTPLATPPSALASALYLGEVRHRRFQPRHHAFSYRLFMLYLDLEELNTLFQGHWGWRVGHGGFALARFCREDHTGDPTIPLDATIRALVTHELGHCPCGPIRLLTHLRYFGYCFNPLSVYYCFHEDGETVGAWVLEVTNTPWRERICYVVAAADAEPTNTDSGPSQAGSSKDKRHFFPKRLHVSPFMPMELTYAWYSTAPGRRLGIHLQVHDQQQLALDATLRLQRQPLGQRQLNAALLRFPWMTAKVIATIHWEALKLWWKGIPLHGHPNKAVSPSSSSS